MTSLIISGLVVITLICTGLFVILCAIDAEKNKREMGL